MHRGVCFQPKVKRNLATVLSNSWVNIFPIRWFHIWADYLRWVKKSEMKKKKLEMNYAESKIQECVHESTRQSCYMLSYRFQWNFASLKGQPQNSNRQTGFCFSSFWGRIDHPPPPVFLGFHWGNRFKMGKMYEAFTAMVFNRLLWETAYIIITTTNCFIYNLLQLEHITGSR